MIDPSILRVAINDTCDLEVLKAAIPIVADRMPKIEFGNLNRYISICEMTWTRLDSPKQALSIRISNIDGPRMTIGGREGAQAIAKAIIERAHNDSVTIELLRDWKGDLTDLSIYAAMLDAETGEPSINDHCCATSTTPWSSCSTMRTGTKLDQPLIATLDPAIIESHLPNVPPIALIRKAKFNKKGGARITVEPLNASSTFINKGPIERLRLAARFPMLESMR